MSLLMLGQTCREVAEELELPESTVRDWSRKLKGDGVRIGSELDDRVYEWMVTSLHTLMEMTINLREPEFLRRLTARELALMHGQMFDRMRRALQGYQGGWEIFRPEAGEQA